MPDGGGGRTQVVGHHHSVGVLPKIDAHGIHGQADAANKRITGALSTPKAEHNPADEGDADSEPAA